ncbi:hypothetical protein [Nocardia wallacei]|uniref:hypothetical protein n=1 Tax=Nocardia wallacei TaxID=480035 RepID=UPI002456E01B|nr:hypothetical protein [Nocardia wallacei]
MTDPDTRKPTISAAVVKAWAPFLLAVGLTISWIVLPWQVALGLTALTVPLFFGLVYVVETRLANQARAQQESGAIE